MDTAEAPSARTEVHDLTSAGRGVNSSRTPFRAETAKLHKAVEEMGNDLNFSSRR
jgi:hypothetical protein